MCARNLSKNSHHEESRSQEIALLHLTEPYSNTIKKHQLGLEFCLLIGKFSWKYTNGKN